MRFIAVKEQEHPDHRTGKGQLDASGDDFADERKEQQLAQGGEHGVLEASIREVAGASSGRSEQPH